MALIAGSPRRLSLERPDVRRDDHTDAGGQDVEAGAVSFRLRDGTKRSGVLVDQAVAEITAAISERRQV